MVQTYGLTHINLAVRDLGRALRFYEQVFGLREYGRGDGLVHTQAPGREGHLRQLLTAAFADLPLTPHVQLLTVPGIGVATAPVLVAKIVDIDRFATPDKLVGYFGVFPEENTSGVDKHGNRIPPSTMRMSRKGNHLARHYLWNAARAAISCNPAIRALYRRLKAKGMRGDVTDGASQDDEVPL